MSDKGILPFAFGVILVGTSLLNPDFYFKDHRFSNVVKILGRTGVRILVGLIGTAMISFGLIIR
jgi:hypothetical protein